MTAWAEELAKSSSATADAPKSEAEEYGIRHFAIRELGRPFHPDRWCANRGSEIVLFWLFQRCDADAVNPTPHARATLSTAARV